MKILTVSNLYPPHEVGGYELRCFTLVKGLLAGGHEVHVLTSDHRVPGRPETPEKGITRTLRIHGMYGHPWLPIWKLYQLERHNHRVFREQLHLHKPDLIHIWNMGGLSKSLLHDAEQPGIPVVYDISDHWVARSIRADVWLSWWNTPGSAGRRFGRKLLEVLGIRRLLDRDTPTGSWERFLFRRMYFCSRFMRDFTASKGWPVADATFIHCGIDAGAFTVKTDWSCFEKLLWVGRINEEKDPWTAVRALAEAHSRGHKQLTLDLYGNGTPEDLARLESEIKSLGLEGHVSRRTLPPLEMPGLYVKYDALLFTSNWGEPFALTPLEAGAAALPVISSLDGGQKELVRDGENSIQATAGDPVSYANGIDRLAADPALRERVATNARREVVDNFTSGQKTREIEAYLKASLVS
ncbi:MAG: glycosyltransferase family 1 protein [Verrucomicrobiales bacterium]|nr:glycosyltransferase family 1 protein [Verrucomicrobiales bacterium]